MLLSPSRDDLSLGLLPAYCTNTVDTKYSAAHNEVVEAYFLAIFGGLGLVVANRGFEVNCRAVETTGSNNGFDSGFSGSREPSGRFFQ